MSSRPFCPSTTYFTSLKQSSYQNIPLTIPIIPLAEATFWLLPLYLMMYELNSIFTLSLSSFHFHIFLLGTNIQLVPWNFCMILETWKPICSSQSLSWKMLTFAIVRVNIWHTIGIWLVHMITQCIQVMAVHATSQVLLKTLSQLLFFDWITMIISSTDFTVCHYQFEFFMFSIAMFHVSHFEVSCLSM